MSSDPARTVTLATLLMLVAVVFQIGLLGLLYMQTGVIRVDYLAELSIYLVLLILLRATLSRFLAVILAVIFVGQIAATFAVLNGYLIVPNALPIVPYVDFPLLAIGCFGALISVQGTFRYRAERYA